METNKILKLEKNAIFSTDLFSILNKSDRRKVDMPASIAITAKSGKMDNVKAPNELNLLSYA